VKWKSGPGEQEERDPDPIPILQRAMLAVFKTQYYLGCELLARFYGLHRDWQYLSDGGHFENTAVYELLREKREVRLIVVCDCGADPDYEFGDLSNLMRLARIDFKVEIEVDQGIVANQALAQVFAGHPKELHRIKGAARDDKCALLLNAYRVGKCAAASTDRTLAARIVLLKPRLIASASTDLLQYKRRHATFPQESTADQFFDEAQWESYRKLGLCIGTRVFGAVASNGVGPALQRYLFGA